MNCFRMKSKKQPPNKKHSSLIQESRFKRSKSSGSSIKDRNIATTVNSDANISNLNTRSLGRNDTADLSESPSTSKRVFRFRNLLKFTEQNPLPPVKPRSRTLLVANTNDISKIHTNSSSSQIKASSLYTTQGLSSKPKLPPISSVSSSSSLNHQYNPGTSSTIHTPGACGLKNIGNTCYMNSTIQCLSSIPYLTKWALKQPPSSNNTNVIDVYVSLVQAMWSGGYTSVNPRELKNSVSRSALVFSDNGQKDSQEFMNTLLNVIEAADPNSFMVNLFRINTQSKTICSKHQHVDTINELTNFLPLPIPQMKSRDQSSVLLEDLIKDFCQEEDLDGTYYCHKCNECMPARQKTTIIRPVPSVLIIQLKRFPFDGTNRKIDTLVKYKPEYRNLLSDNDKYELCAVSLHSGSLSGGHYTTIARNYINRRWYRFDDSYVEEIGLKNVDSPFFAQQAYVLVYLKQNELEMSISEELNTQQLVVTYDGSTPDTVCIYDLNLNNVKFLLSSSYFYQWYDFDLRALSLLMKLLVTDALEESSSNIYMEPIETNQIQSSCTSSIPIPAPSIDHLLLIFIRYLQLIQFMPWSPALSICDSVSETSKQNETSVSPQATPGIKNQQKKSVKPGLCGLSNIGNTCFMNSAIQCLSNIPQLTKWAKNQETLNHEKGVTQAYTSLIKSMWSGDNSCVTPYDIKKRVSQHASIFSGYDQQDSHEFMNSLLNALHSELQGGDTSEEQSSIVTDLFRIQTESGVTCLHCNTYDPTEEVTYCLPLPLGDESKISLETLLSDFLKEEELNGEYYCSHCQDLRLAKQKTSIRHPLPPVIIVQLKRFPFDGTDEKLDTLVTYPLVNWKVDENDSSLYDLIAISMHTGNLNGGHYTTYARLNASDQWYHFNDSFLEPVKNTNCLVNRNAYVLVYLKKN